MRKKNNQNDGTNQSKRTTKFFHMTKNKMAPLDLENILNKQLIGKRSQNHPQNAYFTMIKCVNNDP